MCMMLTREVKVQNGTPARAHVEFTVQSLCPVSDEARINTRVPLTHVKMLREVKLKTKNTEKENSVVKSTLIPEQVRLRYITR